MREWTEKRRAHRRSNDDGFIGGAAGANTGEAVVLVRRGEGRFRDEGEVALERRAGGGAGSHPRRRGAAIGSSGGAGHEEAGKGEEMIASFRWKIWIKTQRFLKKKKCAPRG